MQAAVWKLVWADGGHSALHEPDHQGCWSAVPPASKSPWMCWHLTSTQCFTHIAAVRAVINVVVLCHIAVSKATPCLIPHVCTHLCYPDAREIWISRVWQCLTCIRTVRFCCLAIFSPDCARAHLAGDCLYCPYPVHSPFSHWAHSTSRCPDYANRSSALTDIAHIQYRYAVARSGMPYNILPASHALPYVLSELCPPLQSTVSYGH